MSFGGITIEFKGQQFESMDEKMGGAQSVLPVCIKALPKLIITQGFMSRKQMPTKIVASLFAIAFAQVVPACGTSGATAPLSSRWSILGGECGERGSSKSSGIRRTCATPSRLSNPTAVCANINSRKVRGQGGSMPPAQTLSSDTSSTTRRGMGQIPKF